MNSAEWDRETEKRIKPIIKWLLDPDRKPPHFQWTAGGERMIADLIQMGMRIERERSEKKSGKL